MYGVKHEQFIISDKGFHAWVVSPEVRLANVIHLMVIPAYEYGCVSIMHRAMALC